MSSHATDSNWVKFPLVKFSHHTGPNGTRSHTWTHVNYRNDLEFVLRDVRVVDDYGNHEIRSWMKVIGGNEILESQDLSKLVIYSKEFASSGEDHPVDIIVKSPFLAMKYPKTSNTVRRIQVKFCRESDFTQVIQMFIRLGLSVLEKDASNSTPVAISVAPSHNYQVTGSSNANISLSRPSSTSAMPFSNTGVSCGLSQSSPAKTGIYSHTRPESTISEDYRHISEMSNHISGTSRPFSANSSNSAIVTSSSAMAPLLFEKDNPWPSLLSQKHIQMQNRHMSQPISQTVINNSNCFISEPSKTTSLQFTQKHLQDNDFINQSKKNKSNYLTVPPPVWSLLDEEKFSEVQVMDNFSINDLQSSHEYQNSNFTPINVLDDQKIQIPPKRELPFLRPVGQIKNQSTAVEDLPPLPKPTPVAQSDIDNSTTVLSAGSKSKVKSCSPKKAARQKSTAVKNSSKLHTSDASKKKNQESEDKSLNLSQKSKNIRARSSSRSISPIKKRVVPTRSALANKRPKMTDQSTQTETNPGLDDTAKSKNSTESDLSHITTETLASLPFIDTNQKLINNSISNTRDGITSKEIWDIPGYTEASDEIRHSLLKNFICENLENKEFLRLCKDLEFSWHRISLGKQNIAK